MSFLAALGTAGVFIAILAALLHVFIFYLESVAWGGMRANSIFSMTEEQAENTRELAFNQGFYNLFLAIMTLAGVVTYFAGGRTVGLTLMLAGCGSMLAAALVLLASSPDKRPAAIKQGALPLLATLLLLMPIV